MNVATENRPLRVAPQTVRKLVENGLRDAIVHGRFKPGEHLADRVLCELFGASRTVVREAIRLLEAEGLVSVLPNRGAFVAYLPIDEAAQIYEVRGVLEALAGEGFAVRASERERAQLKSIFDEMSRHEPGGNGEDIITLKKRFYDVLFRGCRNDYIVKMLTPLLSRIVLLRGMSLSAPGRLPKMLEEIRCVIDAIERRSPEQAAQACRDHVRRAGEVALQSLQEMDRARNTRGQLTGLS